VPADSGVPIAAYAAPEELRGYHLCRRCARAYVERVPQRRISAARAICVEALRIDTPHAPQQAQRRAADHRFWRRAIGEARVDRRDLVRSPRIACLDDERRWCPIAQAEARTAHDLSVIRIDLRGQAGDHARDVVADVHDARCARLRGEERVERRDPVCLGRRYLEPFAGVVERARADPADAIVDRVQHGQQQVASLVSLSRAGRVIDRGVDRSALQLRGRRRRKVQVH
jgi:hypothetical protein